MVRGQDLYVVDSCTHCTVSICYVYHVYYDENIKKIDINNGI